MPILECISAAYPFVLLSFANGLLNAYIVGILLYGRCYADPMYSFTEPGIQNHP